MRRIWIYLINPFLVLGLRNFKKAVKISTWTDAALAARVGDPFYAARYAVYHPIHLALVAAYNEWKAQRGTQKGSTVLLKVLMEQLVPGKINAWDALVQTVFAKGSPGYVAILPNGHSPFNEGS